MDSVALKARLGALSSRIEEIISTSGVAGLSCGVTLHSQTIYSLHKGFRDVEKSQPPGDDTLYGLGSCSKAFTAAALGVLVQDGKTTWDTPIIKHIPNFRTMDSSVASKITVRDILAHRMGVTRSNQLWHGKDNKLLLRKSQVVRHFRSLKQVQAFRSKMHYNNWGYALASTLIEELTDDAWGNFVHTRLLEPLGMFQTRTKSVHDPNLMAQPYAALSNRSVARLSEFKVEDGTIMDGSQGLWSSLSDMLRWTNALLESYNDPVSKSASQPSRALLPYLAEQMSPQIPIDPASEVEHSYGMGWAMIRTPSDMGALGCNPGLVASMPLVGKGTNVTVFYHQGSLAGYTTNIMLIPSEDIGIVVLTNSIQLNDGADWIAQMILEAVIDTPEPNEYFEYARESAENMIRKFPSMFAELEKEKSSSEPLNPLPSYCGTFANDIDDFRIQIFQNPTNDGLRLAFQGLPSQTWPMEHISENTFSWLMTHDDAVIHCRFPFPPLKLYKISFSNLFDGLATSLHWNHDLESPPDTFTRINAGAPTSSFDKAVNGFKSTGLKSSPY